MKIVKLTEDNMEQYSESIDPDYAENKGSKCTCGKAFSRQKRKDGQKR